MSPTARQRAARILTRLSRGAHRVVTLPRTRALLALLQEEGYHVAAVSISLHLLDPERSGTPKREDRTLVAELLWPSLGIVNAMPARVLPVPAPAKRAPRTARAPRGRAKEPPA